MFRLYLNHNMHKYKVLEIAYEISPCCICLHWPIWNVGIILFCWWHVRASICLTSLFKLFNDIQEEMNWKWNEQTNHQTNSQVVCRRLLIVTCHAALWANTLHFCRWFLCPSGTLHGVPATLRSAARRSPFPLNWIDYTFASTGLTILLQGVPLSFHFATVYPYIFP